MQIPSPSKMATRGTGLLLCVMGWIYVSGALVFTVTRTQQVLPLVDLDDELARFLERPGPGVENLELCQPEGIAGMVKHRLALNEPTVEQCYATALLRKPDLYGRWRTTFDITPGGSVENVEVWGRRVEDQRLETCVASSLRALHFNPLCGTQPVVKTWLFTQTSRRR